MKNQLKPLLLQGIKIKTLFLFLLLTSSISNAADAIEKKKILFDVSHKIQFYVQMEDTANAKPWQIKRNQYILNQMTQNANALNAEVVIHREKIKADYLKDCDLLYLRAPKSQFSTDEISAIHNYLNNGGSLFMVMDVDYWVTLEETNVNDILAPYDIRYEGTSPDTLSGGYSIVSAITEKSWKIPFHGGRLVKGGTPFCYNIQSKENPHGVYKELKGGGKIIVLGDGMVTLYMNQWKDVKDYQCSGFMEEVFAWLLN
ncbi:GldG family protein [Bacteroidales bacterium]|nr:GldG family protein [Bacteroidales bacterium]